VRTLRNTTAEQVRALRKRSTMTQQGLADRLAQLGARIDRSAVARIESGDRELSLEEAFQVAWALHVAPVHLFVPIDSEEPIDIGPKMQASPDEVRAWIRGKLPLFQDARIYFSTAPEAEFKDAAGALAAWLQQAPIQTTTEEEGEEDEEER
jgi:transcriptional regulator with XRE-family HTH domain